MFLVKIQTSLVLPIFSWKEKNPSIIFKMTWKSGHRPARGGTQGVDGTFWMHFRYYCPPECCTCCCHGAPASTARCWRPPSVSPASLATRMPLAQKWKEIHATRFPPWPKMVEATGSGFPSSHMDASRAQGTASPPPTAGGSSAPSPALQPSPSEYGEEDWHPLYPPSRGVWSKAETIPLRLGLGVPSGRPTLSH